MKNLIALFLLSFVSLTGVRAQSNINGAWKMTEGNKQHQLFFQDGFFFHTTQEGTQFIMARGGNFEINNNVIEALFLFNSGDSSEVNQKLNLPYSITSDKLVLKHPEGTIKFDRVDEGKAPLAGVWKITGRMGDDGEVKAIHQTGTRQTYKLLTGTKFQWVAIDPGKKQFSGTGGGSYTFVNGKYTENIEFFSRDNSRVGASLSFEGKLKDGNWHHSGLSSKGDKIYEVWSRVNAK